jgi:hypothetical protein
MTATRKRTELESALYWLDEQKKWIADHGTTLAAYITRYGRAADPDHYGDGGEAIFAADMAQLDRDEQRAMRALAKASKRARRS